MIPGYYTPQRDIWDDWLRNSARRVRAIAKLAEIPELSDKYSKLFEMIYSGDGELLSLAENIITKKETDYEKTKCSEAKNEKKENTK
jgi:hypothetical protein